MGIKEKMRDFGIQKKAEGKAEYQAKLLNDLKLTLSFTKDRRAVKLEQLETQQSLLSVSQKATLKKGVHKLTGKICMLRDLIQHLEQELNQ